MNDGDGHPDWWDPYSRQPRKLPEEDKPRLSAANLFEYLKVAATAMAAAPLVPFHLTAGASPIERDAGNFVGLGISPDLRCGGEIADMVADLGVEELLIRIPSWDLEHLEDYAAFANRFSDKRLLFNILQCRADVEQPRSWEEKLARVFGALGHLSPWFQVGNAVNRTKWGCAHSGEYLALLEAAERARSRYPAVRLAGSSVIDFEPLVTLRTLLNRHRYHLDAVSALLYVNRRGSPYGRQYYLFDLAGKLRLLHALVSLGNRNDRRLWITEVNWPLLDTRPYTPNSGHPSRTVDEATQAEYLTEYYRIAYWSGLVEKVYWWELINPGCGLVDHRDGLRRMPSYHAFRALLDGSLYEPPSR